MIISLLRTQKILQLQAGNFYNMSLHTFTMVKNMFLSKKIILHFQV